MSPTPNRQRRILVADDDPVIRLLVTSILKKEGYTPFAVEDGREAYRVLQTDADFGAAVFLPKPFTTGQPQLMLRMLLAKSGGAGRQLRRATDKSKRLTGCKPNRGGQDVGH